MAYELKYDGHRLLVFTPSGPGGRVLFQTCRGALVQDAFPDLVAAAGQLPAGLVLDGEVLAWDVEAGTCPSRVCNAGPPPAPAARRPWWPAGRPCTSPSTSFRPMAPT
ncbi:hypothetical protein [Streptomyces sp. NPDC031705]|uniref:hypothetical protein n=1 Tax=Streptomyces sp. NPDC031705 TaxID=3155729 RepID=UPI0033D31E7B